MTQAPILNAEELSLRFQRYQTAVRQAFEHPMLETSQAKLREARREFSDWMLEHGVQLDFITPAREAKDPANDEEFTKVEFY